MCYARVRLVLFSDYSHGSTIADLTYNAHDAQLVVCVVLPRRVSPRLRMLHLCYTHRPHKFAHLGLGVGAELPGRVRVGVDSCGLLASTNVSLCFGARYHFKGAHMTVDPNLTGQLLSSGQRYLCDAVRIRLTLAASRAPPPPTSPTSDISFAHHAPPCPDSHTPRSCTAARAPRRAAPLDPLRPSCPV